MKAGDLCKWSGITYRQLDHWVREGYIHHGNEVKGTGNARVFDATECLVVVMLGRLVSVGFTPDAAAPLARDLVLHLGVDVGPFRLHLREPLMQEAS